MYCTHSYYSNTTMYTTHAHIQLCLYVCLYVRGSTQPQYMYVRGLTQPQYMYVRGLTQPQYMNTYTLYTYVIQYT